MTGRTEARGVLTAAEREGLLSLCRRRKAMFGRPWRAAGRSQGKPVNLVELGRLVHSIEAGSTTGDPA